MEHALTHLASEMVDTRIAQNMTFLSEDGGDAHESYVEYRHDLQNHIEGMPHREVCRLVDALADVASESLIRLVEHGIASPREVAEGLAHALQNSNDHRIVRDASRAPNLATATIGRDAAPSRPILAATQVQPP